MDLSASRCQQPLKRFQEFLELLWVAKLRTAHDLHDIAVTEPNGDGRPKRQNRTTRLARILVHFTGQQGRQGLNVSIACDYDGAVVAVKLDWISAICTSRNNNSVLI